MKTIGLIGGLSWESSAVYYRLINTLVKERLGGLSSAKSVMVSINFAEIEALQREKDWPSMAIAMQNAARQVEAGGADCIVLCTNTMHKVAEEIQAAVGVPFLHIADATAVAVKKKGIKTAGLLGTRLTMEDGFYQDYMMKHHGLEITVPEAADKEFVHGAIYEELCRGILKQSTLDEFRRMMQRMVAAGAEGIILGCTELGLLIQAEDAAVPVFDTAEIHAKAAVDFAMLQPE